MAKKTTKKKTGPKKKLATIRHDQKRTNIPTEELRDFVSDAVQKPTKVLYPRNPDLDPQLVWRGKDEQDASDLEVPAVPIYIQEKIHPHAIIEDFKRTAAKPDDNDPQLDLFSDFNGLPENFDQRVDFYQHDGNWSNRLILGDSLLVMNSLAEKERLAGKVQMIYLDPPYGIKFGSNWQVSTRKREVKDGKHADVTRQPEQVRAFRDTWKHGIHSYLPYLRDRFVVARDLLSETGSIFVQIGDENVHLVRCVMDEVFGSENFCGLISYRTTGGQSSGLISSSTDYLLWYARKRIEQNKLNVKYRQPLREKVGGPDDASGQYTLVEPRNGSAGPQRMSDDEIAKGVAPDHRILTHDTLYSQGDPSDPEEKYFEWNAHRYKCPANTHWKASVKSGGMARLACANRVMLLGKTLRYKRCTGSA